MRTGYILIILGLLFTSTLGGEARAFTHGRPALWPARWIGYGWSDGYHARGASHRLSPSYSTFRSVVPDLHQPVFYPLPPPAAPHGSAAPVQH
jgi:hypothetical protein